MSHTFGAATSQGACDAAKNSTFFGLETWYKYLTVTFDSKTGECSITNFSQNAAGSQTVLGSHSPFLLIGLAILDDLIRVAALVAVGFVIYGGFQYITSQGSPDATRKAQTTIISALVGVVIAVVATALVSFIGNQLGG